MSTARDEIVNAMQKILDNISPINIKLQKIQMDRLFDLYADYNELIPFVDNNDISNGTEENKIKFIKFDSESKTKLDREKKIIEGYLVRELIGGFVVVDNYRVKVREKNCREMGLVHGDLLRIDFKDEQNIVVEKLEDSKTEYEGYRKTLLYCIISDDLIDNELTVSSQIVNGKRKKIQILEENDFIFHITDFEREKYSLRAGDLVDIAYHRDYPKTYKIVWRYNNQQQERLLKI